MSSRSDARRAALLPCLSASYLASYLALTMLLPASTARAYCREAVDAMTTGPCIDTPGVPLLHWTRSCVTYVFNDKIVSLMPLLSETYIRDSFKESFATWQAVKCGDAKNPFYVEQASGFTQTDKAEFLYDVVNESVIAAHTREEWAALGEDPNALALTLLWHDATTGEILDVDMQLNTGAGRFANCDSPCGPDMIDLRNTVTHEAGHLLGLGHSLVPTATMYADAPDGETQKRTLDPDDIAGYCSLDLPSFTCPDAACMCPAPPIYPSTHEVKTCACEIIGGTHGAQSTRGTRALPLGGLLALLGLVRARALRRRKQR